MPMMQVAIPYLNERFGPGRLEELAGMQLDLDQSFGDLVASVVGRDLPQGFAAFIDTMPIGLQRAIIATAQSAVERQLPVTFAWAPGYDWELSMWDVADTTQTHGGVTMLIRSRYPDDPHPMGDQSD